MDEMIEAFLKASHALSGHPQFLRDALEAVERAAWRRIVTARKDTVYLIGCRGKKTIALAIFQGGEWRHVESLHPVCFVPDVYHLLPTPPGE